MVDKKPGKSPSKEKLMFKVAKGALLPADHYTHERLRVRRYRVGDLVSVTIRKPRNPAFNRLAHRIGQLVVTNIDDFHGMDAHKALKKLQIEANAACDEIAISPNSSEWNFIKSHWMWPGIRHGFDMLKKIIGIDLQEDGKAVVLVPRSLSFESMDEGEFNEAIKKICNYIVDRYWGTETPEAIERMADSFVEAV